jgi:hypothetical protein
VTFTPLHTEIVLAHPDVDEVRDFSSLIVRIRDENDVGINVDFERYLIYRKTDESFALDDVNALVGSGIIGHWLYEKDKSEFLEEFKKRNPHINPNWDLRHYLVVTDNDVIDVIALKPPTVWVRSDNIRRWIRPGETRSR